MKKPMDKEDSRKERNRLRARAQRKALYALSHLYPNVYRRLYAHHLGIEAQQKKEK